MGTQNLYKNLWFLLNNTERKRAVYLAGYLLAGTLLEVASIGVLIPLIQVLTQSNLHSKYEIVDKLFPNSSDNQVVVYVMLAVLAVFLLKEVFLGVCLWKYRGFIARLETRFQTELYNSYTNQPFEFHLSNNSSLLTRNILNSANFINNIVDPVFILLTDGVVTIALCITLIALEPIPMLVTISCVGSVAGLFHRISKVRISGWGLLRQDREGKRLQMLNESLNGIKDIVINGREKYFQMRFAQVALDLSNLNRNFMTLLGIPRLYLELLAVVGLVALNLTAIVLGRSSESLLPMLALFAGGAFRLMPAANRVAFAFQSLKMGRPIVDAMQLDLNSSSDFSARVESDVSVEFRNQIRFEGVSYSYPNSNKFAIDQMSFEIEKGSEVGILGTTGAGKSTLVDILLGLLRPTYGRVTVDGVDISTNIRGWQALVGYVPQTIFLIDSSIRANIAFGIDERDIDDERIMRTLVLAQLNEFVDGLPAGINELVGERGVRLSGGQRQRIGIARALYLDPPILVFDEATSALDLETEKEVMKSIDYLRNEKTIVIVTHRFSALEHCDQTIRVDEGKPTFKQ